MSPMHLKYIPDSNGGHFELALVCTFCRRPVDDIQDALFGCEASYDPAATSPLRVFHKQCGISARHLDPRLEENLLDWELTDLAKLVQRLLTVPTTRLSHRRASKRVRQNRSIRAKFTTSRTR